MDTNQRDNLLREIMEIERKYSSEKKNERSNRKEKLKELVDRAAAEVEEDAPPQS